MIVLIALAVLVNFIIIIVIIIVKKHKKNEEEVEKEVKTLENQPDMEIENPLHVQNNEMDPFDNFNDDGDYEI